MEQLTGPRWPSRLLRSAFWLALCAGAVLVVVVKWTGRPALLARGSDQAIAMFVAGTLLASLVVMFAIRAAALYANRRLISREPASRDSGISLQHPSG